MKLLPFKSLRKLFKRPSIPLASDQLSSPSAGTLGEDTFHLDKIYKPNGPLKSTFGSSREELTYLDVIFHFRESSQISLTVGSSWYGGDYMEFGSHDLNTFRNMLSAYHISGMCQAYKDVRFYAFDIFGKLEVKDEKLRSDILNYFSPYSSQGDKYQWHLEMIKAHGLYVDQCILVQGLFEQTLTNKFKTAYLNEKRKIGFAFLDCNVASSYKTVFEFIFDLLAENSYVYMDEYFQNPDVIVLFNDFCASLRARRKLGAVYIRNAGGFGGLFRVYPISDDITPLNLSI
jgi:hypothetical protein